MLGGWVKRALRPAPVIVVRRRSPDWTRIDDVYWRGLADFEQTIGREPGSVRALIEAWNAAMSTSFFDVRQRMKQITDANLRRLQGAKVIDIGEYRERIDPEAIYVFTDDDDWFAPNLASELRSVETDKPGFVWTSLKYAGKLDRRPANGLAYTNNYALYGRFLAERPELVEPAVEHFTLQDRIGGGELTLGKVEMSLAITNKHPCSTITLEQAVAAHGSGRDALRQWLAGVRKQYERMPDLIATGTQWAKPEMEAVRRIMAAL